MHAVEHDESSFSRTLHHLGAPALYSNKSTLVPLLTPLLYHSRGPGYHSWYYILVHYETHPTRTASHHTTHPWLPPKLHSNMHTATHINNYHCAHTHTPPPTHTHTPHPHTHPYTGQTKTKQNKQQARQTKTKDEYVCVWSDPCSDAQA